MVDDTQPGTASADSARGHAPCRIDRWSPDGWTTMRHYADHGLAEHALVELRRREPEALLRLVRRTAPDSARIRPVVSAPHGAPQPFADYERSRTTPTHTATLVRAVGALGLIVLATLACIAAFSNSDDPVATPRSAASEVSGAAPSPPSTTRPLAVSDPGPLAGTWGLAETSCTEDVVTFLPGREIRVAAGTPRARAVASYLHEVDGTLRISFADGGTALYVAEPDRLRLVRARVADIEITPQLPWLLRRCPTGAAGVGNDMPEVQGDAVEEAFRLAVRVGDDLAATLALAHGLSATVPLPGGPDPLALAMAYDRAVIVAKLLTAGADPDSRGGDGRTPLSRAVLDARPALVEALLAGGADPRRTDADGARPLDHAAAVGDEELIDLLMAAGR